MESYNVKIELLKYDDIIEIRYFEDLESIRYRSWKMPVYIVEELKPWWSKRKEYPIKERGVRCEFTMNNISGLYMQEINKHGTLETIGWDIPGFIVLTVNG